jgi:hypothetical protein
MNWFPEWAEQVHADDTKSKEHSYLASIFEKTEASLSSWQQKASADRTKFELAQFAYESDDVRADTELFQCPDDVKVRRQAVDCKTILSSDPDKVKQCLVSEANSCAKIKFFHSFRRIPQLTGKISSADEPFSPYSLPVLLDGEGRILTTDKWDETTGEQKSGTPAVAGLLTRTDYMASPDTSREVHIQFHKEWRVF